LNLLKNPSFGLDAVEVAFAILSRRRPKQTVHAPRSRRINEVNVSQKPGPVMVSPPERPRFSIWFLTYASRAMSMMNAINVMRAAINATSDAKSVTVICCDVASKSAIKDTPAATG